jgi:hypothetical protein
MVKMTYCEAAEFLFGTLVSQRSSKADEEERGVLCKRRRQQSIPGLYTAAITSSL